MLASWIVKWAINWDFVNILNWFVFVVTGSGAVDAAAALASIAHYESMSLYHEAKPSSDFSSNRQRTSYSRLMNALLLRSSHFLFPFETELRTNRSTLYTNKCTLLYAFLFLFFFECTQFSLLCLSAVLCVFDFWYYFVFPFSLLFYRFYYVDRIFIRMLYSMFDMKLT